MSECKQWPKKLSPAMTIMRTLWDNRLDETGHSWMRLNHALAGVLSHTIAAGVAFGPNDFHLMATFMRTGYWFGDSGGEQFYTDACSVSNLTACTAFENWKGRAPFILHGNRLCIGAKVSRSMTETEVPSCKFGNGNNGVDWFVTSFRAATATKPEAVNLTRYEWDRTNSQYPRLKLAGRTSIDRAKITALQAAVREARKAAKQPIAEVADGTE